MNITLGLESESLLGKLMQSGRYQSPDELVLEALCLLEDQDRLRAEIQIGWDEAERGELLPFDLDEIKREGRRLLDEERARRA